MEYKIHKGGELKDAHGYKELVSYRYRESHWPTQRTLIKSLVSQQTLNIQFKAIMPVALGVYVEVSLIACKPAAGSKIIS